MGISIEKTIRGIARATLGIDRRPPSDLILYREATRLTPPRKDRLRLASYNILAGRHTSLERVAQVLAKLDADIIALQEVDHGLSRTGREDQTARLAEALGARGIFAGAIRRDSGSYGIALLSRLPLRSVKRYSIDDRFAAEARVALDAEIELGEARALRIIATHADHMPWSSTTNLMAVKKWISPSIGRGVVLLGDLNSPPWFPGPKALFKLGLIDLVGHFDEGPTFTEDLWKRRLDYAFADGLVASCAKRAERINANASDHRPIVLDLDRKLLQEALSPPALQ